MKVTKISFNSWDVEGNTDTYMVALKPYSSCTCMWWTINNKDCKHIKAVKNKIK